MIRARESPCSRFLISGILCLAVSRTEGMRSSDAGLKGVVFSLAAAVTALTICSGALGFILSPHGLGGRRGLQASYGRFKAGRIPDSALSMFLFRAEEKLPRLRSPCRLNRRSGYGADFGRPRSWIHGHCCRDLGMAGTVYPVRWGPFYHRGYFFTGSGSTCFHGRLKPKGRMISGTCF